MESPKEGLSAESRGLLKGRTSVLSAHDRENLPVLSALKTDLSRCCPGSAEEETRSCHPCGLWNWKVDLKTFQCI